MSVDDHMDRLTVAHHAITTAWTDIQTRGYLKEHPDLILHDLDLIEAALREVRAAAEQEKPGWGELQADPHEDFEERVADYQAHSCDCDYCYQAQTPQVDHSLPVLTKAAHKPTPEDYAKAAAAPIPERGTDPTPAWFEFRPGGWSCEYPHPDPSVLCGALNIHDAIGQGLEHLNTHHPGWKTPCAACRRPQWNADENPRCHDCRTN